MLRQYRRHTSQCTRGHAQHNRHAYDCRCMVYVEGKIDKHGPYLKESTGTRSWERARQLIVAAEKRGTWEPCLAPSEETDLPATARPTTVTEAVDLFLEELQSENGRNLAKPTYSKYKTLLSRLKAYCSKHNFTDIGSITVTQLHHFKKTWSTGPRATRNNIQRLRSFFAFCLRMKWVEENAAKALEVPRNIKPTQKLPYMEDEIQRILETAKTLKLNAQQSITNGDLYAFILALRYTGLRISDVALLKADRLQGNKLLLYTQKTGTPVFCPFPQWVANVLREVPVKQKSYLFCAGSVRMETCVDLWRRRLAQVFAAAGVPGGTPHRFRHTFAVDLLTKGVETKNVSLLLGHDSVLTTEKHYSAWIQKRQDALTAAVLKAYSQSGQEIHAVSA